MRVRPAVVLEIAYLREIARLKVPTRKVFRTLAKDLGLQVCGLPFESVVEAALEEDWVGDPFDRLIVGHAKARRAGLITKDDRIRKHFRDAIW